MKSNPTKGKWSINHWERGESGVTFIANNDGVNYFSGDAVNEKFFRIVSKIDHTQHNISGSFEGAHIAEITDFSEESKANAKLIAAAPELLKACQAVMKGGYGCGPSIGYMDELKKQCETAINKAIGE